MKKIVLLGDSIREGYDKYVSLALDGIAEVFYPKENCRFSAFLLRHLIDWRADMQCGDDVDLVHWNAGLWDDLIMIDGKHHTPIKCYEEYIERLCQVIQILFPKAKMVFATSTPVREELFIGAQKRFNKDTERYNAAAVQIVKKHGGEINDLYAAVKNCPTHYYSDMTHLYTKEGTRLLTERVIGAIEGALGIHAKRLNYEALFATPDSITGV